MVIKTAKIHSLTSNLLLLGFLIALSSCSPKSSNFISNIYHNTTAKYNAYFYAKKHMEEVNKSLSDKYEKNFNDILRIFPPIDSAVINNNQNLIEECIKKASIAIDRHPNSKWVDDSYVLIGKSRHYNGNYGDAVDTYKYVNTQSEDDNTRHQSLINLMKLFIDFQEYNNAVAVSDYIKNNENNLNKENKRNLFLTRAYLNRHQGDYANQVRNLLRAVPLMRNKHGKAKYLFIIGQIYQKLGYDNEAYKYYEKVLKHNPEYELSFYSRLKMAQVFDFDAMENADKIRKYFRKLLKDEKNKEYRDKIYYEMASFEERQDNLEKAIQYYNESIQASNNNPRQKGQSYLALGKIYYGQVKNFRKAKAYYDSTLNTLPQDEPNYKAISKRQTILEDFVKQLTIIEKQDSLLKMAAMDSAQLHAYLDQEVKKQIEAQEAKNQPGNQVSRTNTNFLNEGDNPFSQSQNNLPSQNEGKWYFYNQAAISSGRSAFIRKWGDRELEDNWRRSQKRNQSQIASNDEDNNQTTETAAASLNNSGESLNSIKSNILEAIPSTPDEKAAARKKIEDAYFNLGNIYNFKLDEKENAINTFKTLLNRFPESEHVPEVLYQLYLIHKDMDNGQHTQYKNRLLNNYPESTFAKLILNPNYREESREATKSLKNTYEIAYKLYNEKQYTKAMKLVTDTLNAYPDNSFSDNMALLKCLITAKTEGADQYQLCLQQFVDNYTESELYRYARKLLQKTQEIKIEESIREGISYNKNFNQQHSYVFIFNNPQNISEDVSQLINDFNKKHFENWDLNTVNLVFGDNKLMVITRNFAEKEKAEAYYGEINKEGMPVKNLQEKYNTEVEFFNFVITENNFDKFYKTRDIEGYLEFFNNNYLK